MRYNVKTIVDCRLDAPSGWGLKKPRRLPAFRRTAGVAAFSLVEVVVALGIFTFALVAIIGLFVTGLNTNKESSDQIQAANFASLLISTRRAVPTDPTATTLTNFALPPLNVTYSAAGTFLTNNLGVAADGTTNNGTPAYNVFCQVGTNSVTGPHLALVHLVVWSPITAAFPTNNPSSRYEITTQVALP
jgi:uncharacterized protein (TIGR02598 family)